MPGNTTMEAFTCQIGEEITDPAEETFLLFSQSPVDSQNLGFIDPKAKTVQVSVNGRDFTINQSPGVLSSQRAGGTTGAVLWKITPLFAEFIASPSNLFFSTGILSSSSSVLELGCGISPLTGLALGSHIFHYLLTDQSYVQRLVTQNIRENTPLVTGSTSRTRRRDKDAPAIKNDHKQKQQRPKLGRTTSSNSLSSNTPPDEALRFETLDWETDTITPSLSPSGDFDLVIACDCVYNEALVRPLVQTCVDACMLRAKAEEEEPGFPTVCVVAQQLRSYEVCESWLEDFHTYFRVWRIPDNVLPRGLRSDAGFVVHVGVLHNSS